MKNLLIYLSPEKDFNEEHKKLAKIQIDNSLELGWKISDLILATNFPYEYRGVNSIIVPDETMVPGRPNSVKCSVVDYMLKNDMLEDCLYWVHDFDVYQQEWITEEELDMGNCDIAVTNYGRTPGISTAMIYFKKSAKDIFDWININMQRGMSDERAIWRLVIRGEINIGNRLRLLNNTYNFMNMNVTKNYEQAIKPLKVLHFHPVWNKLDFYMYGKSKLGIVLMNDRLIKLFNKHGIK